jgi:2-aminoadipate transaminase
VISLAGGLPDPSTVPVGAIGAAVADALATDPGGALQYGPTDGLPALRSAVSRRAGADASEVIVTSGSQQALDLVARALVDPGDPVVVADPTYVGALQALRASSAALVAIPSDRHGLDVDHLADLLDAGLRPRLVHVVATFDNPTGATLSGRRRVALAELAEDHGFWIVEDDPYGELRWRGSTPTSLRDLTDRAITLGSTSKVLCPGLRVGWAIAPTAVTGAMAIMKQSADLHTSALSQQIAARLLADDQAFPAHVEGLCRTYGERADALAAALARHLPGALEHDRPDGGMFLWAHLADHVRPGASTVDLLDEAVAAGVAFVPGRAFAADDPTRHDRRLRLSFATSGPEELDEAVRRLASVLLADR